MQLSRLCVPGLRRAAQGAVKCSRMAASELKHGKAVSRQLFVAGLNLAIEDESRRLGNEPVREAKRLAGEGSVLYHDLVVGVGMNPARYYRKSTTTVQGSVASILEVQGQQRSRQSRVGRATHTRFE